MSCPLDPFWSQLLMYLFPPIQSLCCHCQVMVMSQSPAKRPHPDYFPRPNPVWFQMPRLLTWQTGTCEPFAFTQHQGLSRAHSHCSKYTAWREVLFERCLPRVKTQREIQTSAFCWVWKLLGRRNLEEWFSNFNIHRNCLVIFLKSLIQ